MISYLRVLGMRTSEQKPEELRYKLTQQQIAALHKMVRVVNSVYSSHEDTMKLLDARTDLIEAFNL